VAVWSDRSKKMYFSLPQMIASSSDAQKDVSYSVVSVPIDDSQIGDDEFRFTNKIWDSIENEVEHGEVSVSGKFYYE
jgi:hypothetical protein